MEFWVGEQLSQSDSSESVINSARGNVNSTINPNVCLEITNDTITGGGEKSNYMKRSRKSKLDSLTMEAVEKFFGNPIDAAAASLAVSRSTLKRFCRDHGISRWPLSKHNKRTANPPSFYVVVLVVVKIKRWSCSSKHHELSGKWWSCGRHDDPPYKLDSMYQVVRLMVSLQRWRTRNAMQKNDRLVVSPEQIVPCVVSVNNKASKKRKRIDLSSCFEEIRERYGKTREKAMNYFGVGTGKLRCILQWWSSTKIPKLIQAPVVTSTPEEAPTSVVAAQFKETMTEQFIENATASTVKILTIKATYNGNMVRFPFTLLDGLKR